jgi:hypothetical protein
LFYLVYGLHNRHRSLSFYVADTVGGFQKKEYPRLSPEDALV